MKKHLFATRSACILTAILLILLSSCAPSADRLLDYQNGEITALLEGRIGELDFGGTLVLSAPVDDGENRAAALRLDSPQSLAGMVWSRSTDGRMTATLGELEIELLENDQMVLTRLIDAFSLSGEPDRISVASGSDEGVRGCEKLTRLDFSDVTVFLNSESGLPVKITSQDLEVIVISFKKEEG